MGIFTKSNLIKKLTFHVFSYQRKIEKQSSEIVRKELCKNLLYYIYLLANKARVSILLYIFEI